jgi:hypothetical protein
MVYPDLDWYASVGERKGMRARCPYASINRCPRYFESVSLLGEKGIASKMPASRHDEALRMWEGHELWPATGETATTIAGGETPTIFFNFCPEVMFDTFKLFASTVIRFYDGTDREIRERALTAEGAAFEKDWRWHYERVEPMHYSECPLYSKLLKEKTVPNVTIHGGVTGQVNIAGETVSGPILHLSLGELLEQIEASDVSPAEKAAATSKFKEFLAHPLVAAIVGGLVGEAGKIVGK